MDSLTQIALGAAVSEATMANKVGRKATIWGAILGTLPDLDVIIPMGDAVSDFTYHRGASHALFFMALSAPIFLWIILKIHKDSRKYKIRWLMAIVLTLFTHALLDSFTVYGTQMYLPFSNYPVGWSTIFVIDPLYTLPLVLGVLMLFLLRNKPGLAYKLNILGIGLSSLYLVWTIAVKSHVDNVASVSLKKEQIEANQILSVPAPFNTLLWRVIAKTDKGYFEGFYSIFDDNNHMIFQYYDSADSLLEPIKDEWAVKRLQWFSKGFYRVDEIDNKIVISDLRMGVGSLYFFRFVVGEFKNRQIIPTKNYKMDQNGFDMKNSLGMLWRRIWKENEYPLFSR